MSFRAFTCCLIVVFFGLNLTGLGAEERRTLDEPVRRAIGRGLSFLKAKGQAADGSFSRSAGPGVTALVTTAILKHGVSADDPTVQRALKWLEGFQREDGGIHREGTFYRNYETCLAILCFVEANADGRYDELLAKADAFVKGLQWDEDHGKSESDYAFGGQGYGKHKRADLSNTSFFVEALTATGNNEDCEAIQKALVFISRCQNLESQHNTTPFPAKNPDGGMIYTPDVGGYSQAGKTANGGLRSYGSMTYAGLKSMIFAGLGPEDKRVKAAVEWIRAHYDLEMNPGMGKAGLYYYYHTFAKALDALGQESVSDLDGETHDWRSELSQELVTRQQQDGSWINEGNERWMEGDPNLVTGYALLALAYCRPKE